MSNASLIEFIEENDDELLKEVLLWSNGADEMFSKGTADLKPFENVASALKTASSFADVVIVSSASAKGLKEDWKMVEFWSMLHVFAVRKQVLRRNS